MSYKQYLLLVPFLLLSSCVSFLGSGTPIGKVDLNRYSGDWYEIASIPNPHQVNCNCTMSNYQYRFYRLLIQQRCWQGGVNGKLVVAYAKAYPIIGSHHTKFYIRYEHGNKGKYWILALDPFYRYAMVGTPNRKYLWILSRVPDLDDEIYKNLLNQAAMQGYPVEQVRVTDQSC